MLEMEIALKNINHGKFLSIPSVSSLVSIENVQLSRDLSAHMGNVGTLHDKLNTIL